MHGIIPVYLFSDSGSDCFRVLRLSSENFDTRHFFIVFGLFVLGSIITCVCVVWLTYRGTIWVTLCEWIYRVYYSVHTVEYSFSLKVVSASIYTFPSFAQWVLDVGKESSRTGRQSGRFSKTLPLLDNHDSAAFFCLCLNAVSLVWEGRWKELC